ncbi:hypothetical protein RF11_07041 [Thelohanellus kitauei]|uniref:Uncharacterized protein n=1 Tax=Thelohanellus kitauei TaxID=669202 RepID=A0A0C2I9T0_THEKT|nr:hypothetical protein RF11_07041 [Thelohanellus kitauei]
MNTFLKMIVILSLISDFVGIGTNTIMSNNEPEVFYVSFKEVTLCMYGIKLPSAIHAYSENKTFESRGMTVNSNNTHVLNRKRKCDIPEYLVAYSNVNVHN